MSRPPRAARFFSGQTAPAIPRGDPQPTSDSRLECPTVSRARPCLQAETKDHVALRVAGGLVIGDRGTTECVESDSVFASRAQEKVREQLPAKRQVTVRCSSREGKREPGPFTGPHCCVGPSRDQIWCGEGRHRVHSVFHRTLGREWTPRQRDAKSSYDPRRSLVHH